MKVKDFLKTALLRAGIDGNFDDLEAEIPDGESKIDNLLNVQLAGKNNDVKAHFFQLFAKQNEQKIDKIISDNNLDISLIDSNGKRKPFNEQLETVLTTLSDASKQKGDNPELTKTIADLTRQLNENKQLFDREKQAIHSEYAEKNLKMKLESSLNSLNFKAEIPESTRLIVAKTLLESKLSEIKGKVVERDGNLMIMNAENPEIPQTDSNGYTYNFNELLKSATADIVSQGVQTQKTDPKPVEIPNRSVTTNGLPRISKEDAKKILDSV